MRRSMTIVTIALATFVLLASQKHAAAINVTPMTIEISAKPGETYTGSFEVMNSMSNGAEPVRIYMEDWDKLPNNDYVDKLPGTIERSCSAWLLLSPTQFDVPFHDSTKVKYTFTVPVTATGSYWTYIMVEGVKKPTEPPGSKDGVQVFIGAKIRYGVRFVINVTEGRRIQGTINEISVAPNVKNAPEKNAAALEAKLVFKNTGNVYMKPVGYFEIKNLDGEKVVRKEIAQFYVFPDREKWVEIPIEEALQPGEYIAMAVLDYGGESLVAGESHFVVSKAAGDATGVSGGK
jgi:P pilus assembly chaperone PapD